VLSYDWPPNEGVIEIGKSWPKPLPALSFRYG
jgi:hypothetical protein